jgi:hypothetical protein
MLSNRHVIANDERPRSMGIQQIEHCFADTILQLLYPDPRTTEAQILRFRTQNESHTFDEFHSTSREWNRIGTKRYHFAHRRLVGIDPNNPTPTERVYHQHHAVATAQNQG